MTTVHAMREAILASAACPCSSGCAACITCPCGHSNQRSTALEGPMGLQVKVYMGSQ